MKIGPFGLIAISIVLASCGGDGGSSSSNKGLFSSWKHTESDYIMNLEGGDFNEPRPYSEYFQDGAQCDCDLTLIGSQDEGLFVLNSCFYVSNSGANGDPGCNQLNQSGTYKKDSNTLTVCGAVSDNCATYK